MKPSLANYVMSTNVKSLLGEGCTPKMSLSLANECDIEGVRLSVPDVNNLLGEGSAPKMSLSLANEFDMEGMRLSVPNVDLTNAASEAHETTGHEDMLRFGQKYEMRLSLATEHSKVKECDQPEPELTEKDVPGETAELEPRELSNKKLDLNNVPGPETAAVESRNMSMAQLSVPKTKISKKPENNMTDPSENHPLSEIVAQPNKQNIAPEDCARALSVSQLSLARISDQSAAVKDCPLSEIVAQPSKQNIAAEDCERALSVSQLSLARISVQSAAVKDCASEIMRLSLALGSNQWYRQKYPDCELVRQKNPPLTCPDPRFPGYIFTLPPPPSPDKNLQIPEQEQNLPPPTANPSLDIVQELDIFTIVEELVLETISAVPEVDEKKKKKNLQSTMENLTPRKRKRLEDKKM